MRNAAFGGEESYTASLYAFSATCTKEIAKENALLFCVASTKYDKARRSPVNASKTPSWPQPSCLPLSQSLPSPPHPWSQGQPHFVAAAATEACVTPTHAACAGRSRRRIAWLCTVHGASVGGGGASRLDTELEESAQAAQSETMAGAFVLETIAGRARTCADAIEQTRPAARKGMFRLLSSQADSFLSEKTVEGGSEREVECGGVGGVSADALARQEGRGTQGVESENRNRHPPHPPPPPPKKSAALRAHAGPAPPHVCCVKRKGACTAGAADALEGQRLRPRAAA